MSTEPPERLTAALSGRYTVERELGQGGMATVYLAQDERHDRKVALKVLKPELAAVVGAERFLAEIRTTANLQHPHILPLFDSGEAGGFLYYVMPFIEGDSLRDRIDREKQLPVEEAVSIVRKVLGALESAHSAGVVHRDIKPANVLMSAQGEPLVADFGIALAVQEAGAGRLTETGLSLGTPYYMSPEQATGDRIPDARSDVYAVGCVLYEMLVGEPPHTGSTAQAVLARILTGEVRPPAEARNTVPPNVDGAVLTALERLPADRFGSAAEMERALGDPAYRSARSVAAVGSTGSAGAWRRGTIGLAAALVVAVGGLGWGMTRPGEPAATIRDVVVPPWGLGMPRPVGSYTALAPDGSGMVFARTEDEGSTWQLWHRGTGALDPTPLAGTEMARNVTYSPDSRSIAYVIDDRVLTRPVADGATRTIYDGVQGGTAAMVGLGWGDDGFIYFEVAPTMVVRAPEIGGVVDTVARLPDVQNLTWIRPLPGSRALLVGGCPGGCSASTELWGVTLPDGDARLILEGAVRAWPLHGDRILYVRSTGGVFVARFDPVTLAIDGVGVPLFEDVGVISSSPQLAVGADGTVLYRTGATSQGVSRRIVGIDRAGTVQPVDTTLGSALYRTVSLSPSGRHLAYTVDSPPVIRLWVKELGGGPVTSPISDDFTVLRPEWTPDGQGITLLAREPGDSDFNSRLVQVASDGSAPNTPLEVLTLEGGVLEAQPVGDLGFLVRHGTIAGAGELDVGWLDGQGTYHADVIGLPQMEHSPRLSPDGRWLAYVSNFSGVDQVYVRAFPAMEGQVTVSLGVGVSPVWARRGNELFYLSQGGAIWSARYEDAEGFEIVEREELFAEPSIYVQSPRTRVFDVSLDDQLFYAVQSVNRVAPVEDPPVFLIRNYFTEVDELLPPG